MILRWTFAFLWIASIFQTSYAQNNTIDHWETVVMANDTWHYFVGFNAGPPTDWQNSAFNDAAWLQGPGGFGYGDGDDATLISTPPNPYSVFIRMQFTIQDTSKISMALLNMDFDDGFVAWINGVEIARSNLGTVGDYPAFNAAATDHEAVMYNQLTPPSYQISKQKLGDCLINGTNIIAIQVNNMSNTSSDMSCIPFLSVAMKTAGLTYRNVPAWFEEPYIGFAGSTLPLIIINSGSNVVQQGVKTMVDMGIIDNGPGKMNYVTDDWNNYDGKAGFEIRGSSSTMFDKNNYGIELWKTAEDDTAFSLLGMPAESDWILHGPYSDKALIRNYLAYALARDMGHYASRTRFCELFLNNQYRGVYVLMERIKRDSARVDIAKLQPTDVTGDQLTGGYIVKIDRSAGDYTDGWFSPYLGTGDGGSGPFFAYSYPQRDKIAPIQKTYIKNKITAFEDALHGNQYLDPYVGYKTFIDVSSFVDYFIMVELSKNTDGYRLSTFLHKDRDGKDPRLHMGPIWDYDLAFGNANYYDAFNTYGWNYTFVSDGWGTPFWWSKMLTDPYFLNMLYCRWHEFRQGVLSDESIMARIDSATTVIGDAADRNFVQWPILGVWVWPNYYVGYTYEQEISYMKTWITDRAAWLDANIPGSTCLSPVNDKDASFTFLLRAYPNPAVEEVNIEVQNERSEKLSLEIFNYTGQLVYSKPLSGEALIIEKVRLQPGAYLIKVAGKENSRTEKIMVQ
jgi:hypothetical protein